MHVAAFSSPLSPDWRWRIVSYEGEMVAESHQTFPTIAAAVASGTQRLIEMNVTDRAELARAFRWTSQRRRR
jgi:hypothetical protein